MKTLLIVIVLTGGTALEAAAQRVQSTGRTPVMRQSTEAPSVQQAEPPRASQFGAAGVQSTLTVRQKMEIMEAVGVRGVVFAAPFRLSPAAPVASGGRGTLSVAHGALVTPGSLTGEGGVVSAYNRLGGDVVSNVLLTIATRAGAHYLFECQALKRGVQVFLDDVAGEHFFDSDPITFVVEATRTGSMTIAFAGDGSPGAGVWFFYGCDVTPTGQ